MGTAALLGVIAGVWFLVVVLLPWGLGHRMAAAMVGGDRWNAGSMLMEEVDPRTWDRLVRLDKACGGASVELCEATLALRSIPPVAPTQPTPAPEAAKPAPPAAAPVLSPPRGNAGAGR